MKDIEPTLIRQLRVRLGLSQEQFAAQLGVAFSTLNRWENAKSAPRGEARRRLLQMIEDVGFEGQPEKGESPHPRRVKNDVFVKKSMEQMLWNAACSIRGEKDAPKFKDYILPIVFIKRLSDVFEDEVERLSETYGDRETALTVIEADKTLVRYYIPPQARWPVISGREKFQWPEGQTPRTLGEQLTMAMRAVVKANAGERRKDLSGVIEALSDSRYRLGLYDVEPDFLGRCYEYLLRKFAEGQGQSAGEFFTPTEVGWLIAYLVRPSQGEEVHDYACGSAGLLIKCELALVERELKVSKPLKLYGQELTGSSYAIARMNMVIHDMYGEIVRGNSMTNPKFRDSDSRLKRFDIVVANPMWNQPFDVKVYENDSFDRFESHGGIPPGKADWAWLQHTVAVMKATGRAAVVLDTGAVTRGSGSKGEDKERNIRKWFVEQDLIEGVVLLPDNLFYNMSAAGIIVVLNRNKPPARKGRIVLVNAGREFEKGRPKNYIPQSGIQKIAQAFFKGRDVDRFAKVITNEEAAEQDYNLSPSRYVDTSEEEEYRPIPEILEELWGPGGLEEQARDLDKELKKVFRDLGFDVATGQRNGRKKAQKSAKKAE